MTSSDGPQRAPEVVVLALEPDPPEPALHLGDAEGLALVDRLAHREEPVLAEHDVDLLHARPSTSFAATACTATCQWSP